MDMADRVPIDLEGLRDRIISMRTDRLWQELSLSKKVRILLEERLETPLVLGESQLSDLEQFLKSLLAGKSPSDAEIAKLAQSSAMSQQELIVLRDRLAERED